MSNAHTYGSFPKLLSIRPSECCPTSNGDYLECCDDFDPEGTPGSPAATDAPDETTDASCSANLQCSKEGLTGDCCPTSDGETYLDCCINRDLPVSARCRRSDGCRALGLDGFCCPTAGT